MSSISPSHVLPAEPLLEQPSREVAALPLAPEAVDLFERLSQEPDLEARAAALFAALQSHLGEPRLLEVLGGIAQEAVRGDERGAACLAALLAVRAPGRAMIERVREFANLHRMLTRLERTQATGQKLGSSATALVERWREVDSELRPFLAEGSEQSQALPHPLDLGPVGSCRRAFRHLVDKLDADGVLSPSELKRLVGLAALELEATSMRAETLAAGIDPSSARHVCSVMPILAAMDRAVLDTRTFLTSLAQTGRTRSFHETHPIARDHLDPQELDRLLAEVKAVPGLQPLHRLLQSLARNPMPILRLAFHAHWLLRMGRILHRSGLRPSPLNLVDAVLLALEYVDGNDLRVPASPQVQKILGRAELGPLQLTDGAVSLPFDDFAARALDLPQGLPVPSVEAEAGEEEDEIHDVKELVAANVNKISILNGLLRNPKVVSTPGVVMLVVQRCRNLQILSLICDDRKLHTGVANRDVPLAMLRSPMRLPVKTLRKFINVRYVSKVELRRMAMDRNTIRREVCDEIERYLKSLV